MVTYQGGSGQAGLMSLEGLSGLVNRIIAWADRLQREHGVLGFPYAVVKKYGDDEGGRQAALITYYGFLSIFPLLLLGALVTGALTVVATALPGQPAVQRAAAVRVRWSHGSPLGPGPALEVRASAGAWWLGPARPARRSSTWRASKITPPTAIPIPAPARTSRG